MTLIVQILSYKITLVLLVSLIILPVGLILGGVKKNGNYTFWSIFLMLLAMLNVFFGSAITNRIINQQGVLGTGVVTHIEGINEIYNDRQVMRYDVLIKTKNDQTIETSFKSSDFNIYPRPENGFSYPQVGVEFTAKYLPKDPRQFIILLNEESDYVEQLECNDLLVEVGTAQQKMNFDKANQTFKENYEKLWKSYQDKNCLQNLIDENSIQIQFDPIKIEKSTTIQIK